MNKVASRVPNGYGEYLEGVIDSFIEGQDNQNTIKETKRNTALLADFLQTKGGTRREIGEIPPADFSEFVLSVRTKERQEYEPLSLRGIVASFEGILKESERHLFERHLKRKSYRVSIIDL